MSDDKIVERIRKMLALAQSSNQGESETAMGKVMEYLTRHNLSLQEIEAADPKAKAYKTETFDEGERASAERDHIGPIVKRFFNVRLVAQGPALHFLGTPGNVEIAVYIYGYLCQMFDLLWQIHEVKNPKLTAKLDRWDIPGVKSSYQRGLANGLTNTLEREKKRAEDEMGLVLVSDPDLDAYMWAQFPKTAPPSEEQLAKWRAEWAARPPAPEWKPEPKPKRIPMTAEEKAYRAQQRREDEKRSKAQSAAYGAGFEKGREIRIRPGVKSGEAPRSLG